MHTTVSLDPALAERVQRVVSTITERSEGVRPSVAQTLGRAIEIGLPTLETNLGLGLRGESHAK